MTKIIAELGTLHNHSLESMFNATKLMFNCGADMVKFQCITPSSVFWAHEKQLARYSRLYMPPSTWAKFFKECKQRFDKPVFASIFDIEFIEPIAPHVDYWKLGYKVRYDDKLRSSMIKFYRPTFISFAYDEDSFLTDDYINLQVQPIYPIKDNTLILSKLGLFRGYSIHSNNMNLLRYAVDRRPDYIEIHCHGTDPNDGLDAQFALKCDDIRSLCNYINDTQSQLKHSII